MCPLRSRIRQFAGVNPTGLIDPTFVNFVVNMIASGSEVSLAGEAYETADADGINARGWTGSAGRTAPSTASGRSCGPA